MNRSNLTLIGVGLAVVAVFAFNNVAFLLLAALLAFVWGAQMGVKVARGVPE